jgi:hypothetical protein
MATSLEFKRSFVVFSYYMGHGVLLLRSRKTLEHPTRIDILFKDVRAIEIRAWFNGFELQTWKG